MLMAVRSRKDDDDGWLMEMIRQWASQKRRAWEGREHREGADHHRHEYGWSATSVLGRIYEERDGASHGSSSNHFPEHYSRNALLVRRAIEGMDEDPYICGHLHYIVPASVGVKSREAGYSPAGYWIHVGNFRSWIKGRILLLEEGDSV